MDKYDFDNKEKLDLACFRLGLAMKGYAEECDYKQKWHDFALRGSVQSRKLKAIQNGKKF